MTFNLKKILPLLVMLVSLNSYGASALRLPSIISDNAVIQQNTDIRLWGWANPGSKVTVRPSWQKDKTTVTTGQGGKWSLTLHTPAASFTPLSITFTDSDGGSKTIGNLLSGEVWLASGQSNMEMPLRGFWTQPIEGSAQAIAYSGNYPGIRMALIPKSASYTPMDDVPTQWKTSAPANAHDFSALAWFFATSLTDMLHVPVGIINCAYGGSKVEGWIPREILDTYPNWNVEKEMNDSKLQEYERINVMYNAMLNPVAGYTLRGFLWNQGESNVGRHDEYPAHMADMVAHWRKRWGNDSIPFYFVELPGWNYSKPEGTDAAMFRECQNSAVGMIPNSDIVCTTDLIYPYELEDIHASKKKEIGERLAFKAAALTYGMNGVPHEFPRFKSAEIKGNKAILNFTGADGGFTPNDVLEGFEVAGADRIFHPAQATEDWNTRQIIVTSDTVNDIKAVRYCFKNFAIGKVKNMYGMPLIPFRTDSWKDKDKFVSVSDGEFRTGGKEYRYAGTNFWYGAILASEGTGGDRERLERELDMLQSLGIDNLRILAGADGNRSIPSHVEPKLQTAPGVYNDTILQGLDYLLDRLEKRGMKAVIYLNNSWEWSGGYGTYLEWAGEGVAPLPLRDGYPAYMEFVSRFPLNDKAKSMVIDHIRNIVGRVNSVNGRPYSQSPAIMSWQIANEPRAFSDQGKEAFAEWIHDCAKAIKAIDPNHLVSTGSEGSWGCENDMDLWVKIHSYPEVDYANIHIWPYNWLWISPTDVADTVDRGIEKSKEYIAAHQKALAGAGKPIVIEEFGYPRDGMQIRKGSSTKGRDVYYDFILGQLKDDNSLVKGVNFWGWGGEAQPIHKSWQPGDPYTGDPAQEDQGLNSVFADDYSTLEIIRKHNGK